MLEKSFEYIISEFNKKFQKINERFDQLRINFNNYTNTEKPSNLSESLTNKEIELKGAAATYVKIAAEMKKCSRLKGMSNFNVL